jgi:hypothetical protein
VSIFIFSKIIFKNKYFKSVFLKKQQTMSDAMGFVVDVQEIVKIMISKFKTELKEPENVVVQ